MPNTYKVLVVDDDPGLRTICQISLEDGAHWTVLTACNGPDAIEIAERDHPDIVLLDIMMPVMDGIAVLEKLRQTLPQTPVIFLTAKVLKHEIEMYRNLGAAGVIMKPFDPMRLPRDIKQLIDKHNDLHMSHCLPT